MGSRCPCRQRESATASPRHRSRTRTPPTNGWLPWLSPCRPRHHCVCSRNGKDAQSGGQSVGPTQRNARRTSSDGRGGCRPAAVGLRGASIQRNETLVLDHRPLLSTTHRPGSGRSLSADAPYGRRAEPTPSEACSMRTVTTDVLVVGAGPAGLTACALLAQFGIPAITLSRHPGTAPQPRASITNQRTVEVFRNMGIEDRVRTVGVPLGVAARLVRRTRRGRTTGRARRGCHSAALPLQRPWRRHRPALHLPDDRRRRHPLPGADPRPGALLPPDDPPRCAPAARLAGARAPVPLHAGCGRPRTLLPHRRHRRGAVARGGGVLERRVRHRSARFPIGQRCEYDDVVGAWTALREIDDRGALLVRPDQHIAWRSFSRPQSPRDALADALRRALARTDAFSTATDVTQSSVSTTGV